MKSYRYPNSNGKRDHIKIIERVLGKPIPKGAVTHHVDGNTFNNINNNLVLCESIGYHKLLHRRRRSLDATGRVDMAYCSICKNWFERNKMKGNRENGYCKRCHATYYWKRKGSKQKQVKY